MLTAKEFLEQYKIDYTRSLDQNTLGSVYKAEEVNTGVALAIKSIEVHPLFDKGEVLKCYQEAMRLSHPNLIDYKEVYRFQSEESHQHFIVMPYIEADNLSTLQPSLSLAQKQSILKQLIDALTYLHQEGVYVQNLRADHLLLKKQTEGEFTPLLINYGAKFTWSAAFLVNYEYMAPEQLAEKNINIGAHTDIWALGVLMYYIFIGQLPFGQKSPQTPNIKIKERILGGEIPQLLEQIPNPYRSIIEGCFKQNKDDRWSSVKNIQEILEEQPKLDFSEVPQTSDNYIIDTLVYMGEHDPTVDLEDDKRKRRVFKRTPQPPLRWWEPVLWVGLAVLAAYLLNTYVL